MKPLELLAHLAELGTPPDEGEAVLRVSAGLEETLGRIELETLPFVSSGGGELQFVFGPYGRGKTHFLKALAQRARECGFATAFVDCQDNQSPFQSLMETYRAIAESMTPPAQGRLFSTSGVGKVIEARFASGSAESQRSMIERVKANQSLSPDVRNLVSSYASSAVLGDGDEALAESLEALLASFPSYRITLGALYRKYPSLPRPLGKLGRRNAADWLRALLSLPRVLGYPGLIVLFDETELALNKASDRQRQKHLAHIRTFVDHMAVGAFQGCAVYYAVAEEFIDIVKRDLDALSQRIARVRLSQMANGRNPRAVWVDLDELTVPGPGDVRFYEELAEHIVNIGREAGLDADGTGAVMEPLRRRARAHAEENISEGRVREYVKEAASSVARELMRRGA